LKYQYAPSKGITVDLVRTPPNGVRVAGGGGVIFSRGFDGTKRITPEYELPGARLGVDRRKPVSVLLASRGWATVAERSHAQ